MSKELREDLPPPESGLSKLAEQAAHYAGILVQQANIGQLRGVLEAWAPNFDPLEGFSKKNLLISIGEILAPVKGSPEPARWQLVEADKRVVTSEQEAAVMELADKLGLRVPPDLVIPEHLTSPDSKADVIVPLVGGGANRTSVVRRSLVLDLLGQRADRTFETTQTPVASVEPIFQFGSDRPIPKLRADGSENPEYKIAQEVTGEHFPLDEQTRQPKEVITEHELNLNSARAQGWELNSYERRTGFEQVANLIAYAADVNLPPLILLQPTIYSGEGSSFSQGVHNLIKPWQAEGVNFSNRRLVAATNGQYRPISELQIGNACIKAGVDPKEIVAIGDETGARDWKVYVREIGVLARTIADFDTKLIEASLPSVLGRPTNT